LFVFFFAGFLTAATSSSRITKDRHDTVEDQQVVTKENDLAQWYDWIAHIYADTKELQFMNYGYADPDEHIDGETGHYSVQLYEQVNERAST
jgi:hypothetical protein